MGLDHVEDEVIHYFTSVQCKRERFSFSRGGFLYSMKVVAISSDHTLCSHSARESRNMIHSANSCEDGSKSCQLQKATPKELEVFAQRNTEICTDKFYS